MFSGSMPLNGEERLHRAAGRRAIVAVSVPVVVERDFCGADVAVGREAAAGLVKITLKAGTFATLNAHTAVAGNQPLRGELLAGAQFGVVKLALSVAEVAQVSQLTAACLQLTSKPVQFTRKVSQSTSMSLPRLSTILAPSSV